jgi:hypothetical protein
MTDMKSIHDVIDDFDNQTLLRTMRSKMFQEAYEEYLMEAGTLTEIERYCVLHAKVAIISNGELTRFDTLELPQGWWRKEE